ncbi:MAG: tyrosine-type recombinase/integrase [Pyrinomonadaceae bacterium]
MTVRKRNKVWWYDFGNHKYRGAIPEARTKHEAEQAEVKIKRDVFEGKYGLRQLGAQTFEHFVDEHYLLWAKANKKTWRNDELICDVLKQNFRGKTLREVSPLAIEKYKRERAKSITKRGTTRSRASVNMELAVLSRIFTLAMELEQAAANPCRKVKQFALDNREYRYLKWEEEPALLTVLENPPIKSEGRLRSATLKVTVAARARLRDAVLIAVGAGLRRSEQLRLKPLDCDFSRNVIVVTKTKTCKSREVPMSDQVRAILQRLCLSKRRDDYLTANPKTGRPYMDYKNGFHSACADAGIEGLTWRHLRATFGTRLGDAGYNAFEIAALMGHSDIRTTQRYVRVGARLHEAVQSTMLSHRKIGAVTIPSQTEKQPLARVAVNS